MAKFFAPLLLSLSVLLSGASVSAQETSAAPAEAIGLHAPSEMTNEPRVLTLDLTRNPNEIWDRIRRGFSMPDLDSQLVADQQLFYLNRPGFLKQVFARGGRYLYYIVDELERRGMPTELALLPMVESSYNPLAYSPAHASGLWQFIPSTGKNYNLTQDSWVDERRDVIASTNAALDYLQTIYEMHGDWHLALASYNWGEGAVARAIQRNVDAGLPAEYSQLRMPDETRNYVPKLQAIKNIVSQPELFHFELPYVPNEANFVAVAAPIGTDLAAAAKLAGLSLEEFLALNPSFNRPAVTLPGQTLIVPTERASHFEAGLEQLSEDGKGWRVHELGPGEKLAAIAQRHDLTLAQLLQLNGLNARSRVGAGYSLLVPDGVDPSGALQVTRLLPNRPQVKLTANTTTPIRKIPTTPAKAPASGKPATAPTTKAAANKNTAKKATTSAKSATPAKSSAKPAGKAAAPAAKATPQKNSKPVSGATKPQQQPKKPAAK
ncbi:transglycosylase SLT domain-containing protein [Azoarcus indigens]|uniref:Membrane-bound lytic murein transglycosylase D n=1 Tax=Azoarcus indigens TaxID=29545 RepID=A0A4R6DRP1_9RHOO|nr:transglycosylase SLT domain-containing protein [Azoarcus indigens]NMG66885.1 transglycosylase SLT domain-containing protein [Azoarcus indigens]TDN47234.1 membrane-bound lytic murein transglycosylase D [Azoarcus indigens]